MESKEIRVYGTLVNHTTIPADGDRARVDSGHNDSIAYAYQLYDQRFGASPSVLNYLDNINKRVKGITYDPTTGRTSTTGDLYVAGDLIVNGGVSGISLGDLDDVNTSGQTAGAILKYNGTNWVPGSDSGGASVLNDLGDVTTTGAQDGDILIYDATAGKWKPSGISLSSIINRISNLEGLWTDNGTTLTAKSGRSVTGAGFYDSTIS